MSPVRTLTSTLLLLILSIGVVEASLRFLANAPTDGAPPRVLGRPLPPLDLLADLQHEPTRYDEPVGNIDVDGVRLTRGDLWGISREDETLGHAPRESTRSANGWWQSNREGARSRTETSPSPASATTRILAFGDSYTHGSRVHQDETWPAQLTATQPHLEVVNFGVDGYGMAQSLLRYRQKRDRLDHSLAVLVSVPGADLVRDVNVFRPLLGWRSPITAPRFELEIRCASREGPPGGLRLVPTLYASVEEFDAENAGGASSTLRQHLRCHDGLYQRARYERLPLIGGLYQVRLVAAVIASWRDRRFGDALMQPDGEAVRVSRAIFSEFSSDVERRGRDFLLVFLPIASEVSRARQGGGFQRRWRSMIEASCPPETSCLDLLPGLRALAPDELDRGIGSHYGPRANRAIARLIAGGIPGADSHE
jgi:hypothetical protein